MVEGRSLILCGPAGVGKTHLGIAIAYRAIQNGTTALFIEADRIMEDLSEASRLGRLSEAMEPYTHAGVLVVDEVGYLSCPPDAANVLFQVVNQRYLRCRPMVFTTNKPLAAWADVLHDADLAEAIIDRVLARGRLLELRGPSYRTRHIKPPPLPPEEPARISGTHSDLLALQLRACRGVPSGLFNAEAVRDIRTERRRINADEARADLAAEEERIEIRRAKELRGEPRTLRDLSDE